MAAPGKGVGDSSRLFTLYCKPVRVAFGVLGISQDHLGFQKFGGLNVMSKRDDLIAQYADDLKNKCGIVPDMDLLTKVTIGCGPAIYDADAQTVAASQYSEIETVKQNFLIKKLGLTDSPELLDAINKVIETYGKSERNKYRAVVYYMLA